ncbi:MAG: ABC transporter ATP-binding protein [Candidatus Thorarchaeota archaeon]
MNTWRAIWRLMWFKPKDFVANVSTQFFFALVPLAIALVIREIFNSLEGISGWGLDIGVLILVLPVVIIIAGLSDIISLVTFFWCQFKYPILLRKNILQGIFEQPGALPREYSSSESISRFRGDVSEAGNFAAIMGWYVALLCYAVVSFLLMYQINSVVTLYIFIPFTLITGIVAVFRNKVTKFRKARRKAAGRVTSAIGEMFGSIQAVKVASAEENVLNYFREINEERRKAAVTDETFTAVLNSVGEGFARVLGVGVILLFVGNLMVDGTFSVGDFAFFTSLLERVVWFVVVWGNMIPQYQRTKVAFERMTKLMKGTDESISEELLLEHGPIYTAEEFPPLPPIDRDAFEKLRTLTINSLSFSYPDSKNGISEVSFEVKRGTLTIITGRVGSGKTTLLRTMLGLLPHNQGTIIWNDTIIDNPDDFFIPPYTAYTPQVPRLFSESIKDNILMGLPENSVDIWASIRLAVLEEEIRGFENGLDSVIGPKGVKLSGGQKQRVAASRMFVREPELLVFDDLSSALDVETEEVLWKRIFDRGETTCLAVSHRPTVLRKADNIIVMKDGVIADQGTLEELLERSEEMKNLWAADIGHRSPTFVDVT